MAQKKRFRPRGHFIWRCQHCGLLCLTTLRNDRGTIARMRVKECVRCYERHAMQMTDFVKRFDQIKLN